MKHPCKILFWYKHDWRKCWYSEYVGELVRINIQLYGTKKCDRCGTITDGYAEKENWEPRDENFNLLKALNEKK